MTWPDPADLPDPAAWLPEGGDVLQAMVQLAIGFGLAWGIARLARRVATRRFTPAMAEVAERLVFWAFGALAVASALSELGIDLSFLMGAAGLLTVALGFASQTSASNLISGLFLLFERPFSIRDVVQVGGTTGEVVSIDLLSVRLRTFDNKLVRVPNETLLKSDITNLSHFPIRRFDMVLRVRFEEDLDHVHEVLCGLADATAAVLDEPRPMLQVLAFTDNGVELQLSVWFPRESFIEDRTQFALHTHRTLRTEGIRFALPPRVLHGPLPSSAPAPPSTEPSESDDP